MDKKVQELTTKETIKQEETCAKTEQYIEGNETHGKC